MGLDIRCKDGEMEIFSGGYIKFNKFRVFIVEDLLKFDEQCIEYSWTSSLGKKKHFREKLPISNEHSQIIVYMKMARSQPIENSCKTRTVWGLESTVESVYVKSEMSLNKLIQLLKELNKKDQALKIERYPGIVPLIYHSDCEGYWNPWECKVIMNLLLEFKDKIEEKIPNIIDEFIKGLEYCFKNNKNAMFQ